QNGSSRFIEPLPNDRRQVNLAGKLRIAKMAIDVVRGDQSLLIDNGSTAESFAAELGPLPEMTIMTNGVFVAQNALSHGTHTVMLTGGRIRPNSMSMGGPMVATCLQQMRFDTFVMSAASVDPEFGLSTFLEDEAQVTRQMMQAAGRVVVLADKTKLMKPAMHVICQTGQIDVLITDLPADHPVIATIESHGVRVLSATNSKENPNEPE
ncbi:MAG: DeoR/GlpR family DNA-binding transcription regulator, partial [Octadecabacter sp.]